MNKKEQSRHCFYYCGTKRKRNDLYKSDSSAQLSPFLKQVDWFYYCLTYQSPGWFGLKHWNCLLDASVGLSTTLSQKILAIFLRLFYNSQSSPRSMRLECPPPSIRHYVSQAVNKTHQKLTKVNAKLWSIADVCLSKPPIVALGILHKRLLFTSCDA